MKYFIKITILFLLFTSCSEAIKNKHKFVATDNFEDIQFSEPKVTTSLIVEKRDDLLGYWVGDFDINLSQEEIDSISKQEENMRMNAFGKITFSIDKIKGDSIYGHSISAGNIRSFKGVLSESKFGFKLEVDELSKESEGTITADIATNDSILKGFWMGNSVNDIKFSTRKFDLKKKLFVYDKNNKLYIKFYNTNKAKKITVTDTIDENEVNVYEDEEYFATTKKVKEKNASYDLLTPEFVSNLSKADIFILRNSIFARHGFAFRDKQLRLYFEDYEWYMPVFGDVKGKLSELEKENINLLIRYEKNAEEYYDTFGR